MFIMVVAMMPLSYYKEKLKRLKNDLKILQKAIADFRKEGRNDLRDMLLYNEYLPLMKKIRECEFFMRYGYYTKERRG